MEEQLLVRLDVTIEVHADKAVELKEARIDVAHEAGIRKRHFANHVSAEPIDTALFGERIHRGRIDAGVDRPAHENHRCRHARILVGLHQSHGGKNRNRRLAHRHHVGLAAQPMQD